MIAHLDMQPVSQEVLALVGSVPGWLSVHEAALLYSLARQVTSGAIIEVGSYRGRSTVALAQGAQAGSDRPVYAIEPHEPFKGILGGEFGPDDRGAFYRSMLDTGNYRNVRLVNLSSEIITPGWKQPVSLLFIDGDHTYEAVKQDFLSWKVHLAADAFVAFDDATDPALGPYKLIREILDSGEFNHVHTIGKVQVLQVA